MSLDRTLRDASLEHVAAALPEDSALVELACFDEWTLPGPLAPPESKSRYLALVLHAGKPEAVAFVDLGYAEHIDGLVASYRSAVTCEQESVDGRTWNLPASLAAPVVPEAGEALRVALDPLLVALGSTRRVFVAPDGELCRLPLEVVPAAGGGYLVDEYHFSYLTSGRDLLRFGAGAVGAPGEAVVIADPDFDLAAVKGAPPEAPAATALQSRDLHGNVGPFTRLPGIEKEGRAVAKQLQVTPWLGAEALEERLRALRSPRVLHVATHGFFLHDQATPAAPAGDPFGRLVAAGRENPLLRSGLALAGANTWLAGRPLPPEAGDGLLNGEDVAGMDLGATELVVLSACETGLGEVHRGEGVYGLRRAFTVAGAKTLVMSLWKVPDEETQRLMQTFYEGLSKGQGRSEALREAQKKLRAENPRPRYWGAFICQGEPGPMPPTGPGEPAGGKLAPPAER
jgi:CHAT domain-containing protein